MPFMQTLEIGAVHRRYIKEIIDNRHVFKSSKMFVFSPEYTCTKNEPLISMLQYFYSRSWLNKILVCDPFFFTLFFSVSLPSRSDGLSQTQRASIFSLLNFPLFTGADIFQYISTPPGCNPLYPFS